LRKGDPSDQNTAAIRYTKNIVVRITELPTLALKRDGQRIARNTPDCYALLLSEDQRSRQRVHPRLDHHRAPSSHLFARREDFLRVRSTHDLASRRRQWRGLRKPSRSVLSNARDRCGCEKRKRKENGDSL